MNDAMPPLALVPGIAEKLLSRIDASGDCWEWTGTRDSKGYGTISICALGGGSKPAQRFVWQLLVGSIPTGFEIDHRCFNPGCVNPDHLEPVTRAENIRRQRRGIGQYRASRTHCPQGHPYDDENTYRYPSGKGGRQCKACLRARSAVWVSKKICSDPDCDRSVRARGMCFMHYRRDRNARRKAA